MRHSILIFFLLCVFTSLLNAQWVKITVPTTADLTSIHFINDDIGWISCSDGKVLKTTDGGNSWISYSTGLNRRLQTIQFLNENVGWVAGNNSALAKSTDGGLTWTPQTIGISTIISSMFFIDEMNGFLSCAGLNESACLAKTTNGGASWQTYGSENWPWLISMYFTSGQTGYAVGGAGYVLKTTNFGTNWNIQTVGDQNLEDVTFSDEFTGWVVGHSGKILKTANGGGSWINQSANTSQALYSVDFKNNDIGITVGHYGAALATFDGGTTWQSFSLETNRRLLQVLFTPSAAWIVGDFGSCYKQANTNLYISNISSNEILTVGTQKNIRWGSFDIASIRLELTTDGGTTWNVISGAEMLPASDSSFLWTIPNTPSTNCKIKIIDYNNPSTFSVSPTFQIKLPPINITIQTDTRWFDTDLNGYATKSVNGTTSSVPGGTITGYQWSVNGVDTDTLGIVDMTLPTGTNTVTLTVTTNLGFQASKSVKVEVLGAKLGLSGSVLSAVSQSGNLYYVTSQDKAVYGFDSTGTIRKQFLTGGSIQSTLCISSQDLLYVGSDDMRAYCFDNQLNSIWDKAMGGMIKSSPTVSEDGSILYLVTNNGIVKAVDALTGAPKWSYVAGSNILASPILLQLPDDSKAVVIGTQGSYSAPPALIALKDLGNNAELLWEKQVDGPVATSPAFLPDGQNSMFYVASGNGVLYRIRWDGFSEEDWKVNLGSQVNNCSPVIDANGLVFIGTGAAKLLAYAPDFVTTSLPVKTFQAGSAINATPAIGSTGNLYVGTQNGMYYAIDITQDSLIADWIYDAKVPFAAPALVTETGVVVNGATNGDVFLFADPDFHPATEQTYKAYWPTFLGNNKRSKVATMTVTSIPEGDALPKTFALNQNYPNPFNPKTVIGYSLPKQSQVELKVYDILGMEVAVLVNQMQPAGNYTVAFDGVSLPSGVYFYQIKTNEYSSVKKMMLIK